jgi:hypothetical protein
MSRLFAIMGSGETTPTMTATHRALKAAAGAGPAVLLDTPYGFQENADDITERALDYFRRSVNFTPGVASLRRATDDPAGIAKAMAALRQASWVFTGPGSPTYALRQWAHLGVSALLADRLARQGVLIMSSAAALTVGVHTVPVYEVYKVGIDPVWSAGMDLLTDYGLPVAVIPHFDNAEGGNHDTRFCYLGETRLRMLESQLGSDQWVIGVDEHTALLLDLDSDTFAVQGKGGVTLRRAGATEVFASGFSGPIDALRTMPGAHATAVPSSSSRDGAESPTADPGTSSAASSVLVAVIPHADAADAAIAAAQPQDAVSSIMQLEAVLEEWKGDTSTTDERDRARQRLHQCIVALAELAVRGTQDPRTVMGPLVDAVIQARVQARTNKEWALSDLLRDVLVSGGLEVRDTPNGIEWSMNQQAKQ